jgi:hypothetical protein
MRMAKRNKSPGLLPCAVVCVSLLYSYPANSAAWTQGKGIGQAILALGRYHSSEYFDKTGHIKNSGNNFTKYEINPFFEYGLTDDITIGANPTIQHWQADRPINTSINNNSGGCTARRTTSGEVIESEVLVRKKLLEYNNMVFSVQPLFKTPCIRFSNAHIAPIWNSYELELRLLAGYGFKWDPNLLGGKIRPFSGQYHFVNIESAYRKRNGEFSDQIKIDGTAGFRFNENLLLLGQLFSVISAGKENVGSLEVARNVFEPDIDRFYDIKLQLSGVKQMTKTSSFQFGIYSGVWGKNYGEGIGVMASIWKGF